MDELKKLHRSRKLRANIMIFIALVENLTQMLVSFVTKIENG